MNMLPVIVCCDHILMPAAGYKVRILFPDFQGFSRRNLAGGKGLDQVVCFPVPEPRPKSCRQLHLGRCRCRGAAERVYQQHPLRFLRIADIINCFAQCTADFLDFCNCHNVPAFHFYKYLPDGILKSGKYLILPDAYAILCLGRNEMRIKLIHKRKPQRVPPLGFSFGLIVAVFTV